MSELRVRRRWAPWMFGVAAGVLGLVFGWIVVWSYFRLDTDGQAIRVFIPPFTLGCYWLLATAFNFRTVSVTPEGVRVTLRPFPTRARQFVRRGDIRQCYARNISYHEDGVELENVFTAGVETRRGVQIDVSGPYK